MAVEDSATDATVSVQGEGRSLPQALRQHISLTRLQGVCGVTAALLSIGGALMASAHLINRDGIRHHGCLRNPFRDRRTA